MGFVATGVTQVSTEPMVFLSIFGVWPHRLVNYKMQMNLDLAQRWPNVGFITQFSKDGGKKGLGKDCRTILLSAL